MQKKGHMYILECSNGKYYTGSTVNLEVRIAQHQSGEGANFTKKNRQLNWYILKNMEESTLRSTEKNKFKVGVE